nr:hypothetical protein [Tabrizicola sp. TH137]
MHAWKKVPHQQERATDHHGHRFIETGRVTQNVSISKYARVVDENIDLADRLDGRSDRSVRREIEFDD